MYGIQNVPALLQGLLLFHSKSLLFSILETHFRAVLIYAAGLSLLDVVGMACVACNENPGWILRRLTVDGAGGDGIPHKVDD